MHAGLAWRSSGSPHRMHCRAAQVAALAKRALNVPHGQSALLWEARTGAVRCGAPSVASSCAQRRGARCLPLPVPREPVPRCALLWATLSSPLVPFPCSLLQRDSWLCMYARMMPTTGLLLERLYTCTVVKMRGRRREREREYACCNLSIPACGGLGSRHRASWRTRSAAVVAGLWCLGCVGSCSKSVVESVRSNVNLVPLAACGVASWAAGMCWDALVGRGYLPI